MPHLVQSIVDTLRHAYKKYDNRSFLESVIAASAMVAFADGNVSFPERVKFDQVLEIIERLKIYDPHEAVELFDGYVAELRRDNATGSRDLLKIIGDGLGTKQDKILVLKICWAISRADGKIPHKERDVINLIANYLNVGTRELYSSF
ncbi:MAG: TerB family tellurite resistance protein [Rhodospirillales bacterium]|nr:TerB family tellurite resistance protein [Rhodospirillales bacterium]